jgi:HPt (histidine-containing phosphotransfer) domain-containing protein
MIKQADDVKSDNPVIDKPADAVDWSVLDDLKVLQKPGKPDLRIKLMTVFLTSMPALMDTIKSSVKARDSQALMDAAHAMKSSSLSLGAMVFGNTCAELEQLGRAKTLDDAPALLSRAENEFSAVCSAFSDALEQNR